MSGSTTSSGASSDQQMQEQMAQMQSQTGAYGGAGSSSTGYISDPKYTSASESHQFTPEESAKLFPPKTATLPTEYQQMQSKTGAYEGPPSTPAPPSSGPQVGQYQDIQDRNAQIMQREQQARQEMQSEMQSYMPRQYQPPQSPLAETYKAQESLHSQQNRYGEYGSSPYAQQQQYSGSRPNPFAQMMQQNQSSSPSQQQQYGGNPLAQMLQQMMGSSSGMGSGKGGSGGGYQQ